MQSSVPVPWLIERRSWTNPLCPLCRLCLRTSNLLRHGVYTVDLEQAIYKSWQRRPVERGSWLIPNSDEKRGSAVGGAVNGGGMVHHR